MNAHPFDSETIMSFLDGELPPASSEEVRAHISYCAECSALVAKLRNVSTVLSEWTVSDVSQSPQNEQQLSLAAQKFHGRYSMPLVSFFRVVKFRYIIAAGVPVLAVALWSQLGPSSITLAQNDLQAKLIKEYSPDPRYPDTAQEKKIQGIVRLQVVVAKDGSVKKLSVLSGDPLLAKSSVDTVRHWKYEPTFVNGRPVEVKSMVEISFVLYP